MVIRISFLVFIAFMFSCQSSYESNQGWQRVFQNDENGEALYGDKSLLIDAVRHGYPVKIGWGGNRVEHVAEAGFLTILEGEVFAQINSIIGQAPRIDGDTVMIRFRPQNKWTKIAGTNGYSTGLMTDYFADTIAGGGTDRYSSTTWYVMYPHSIPEVAGQPLWRKESPNWEQWEAEQQ